MKPLEPLPFDARGTLPEFANLRLSGVAPGERADTLETLRKSRALFYPGSGCDVGPVRRYAEDGGIDSAVYCDYLYGSEMYRDLQDQLLRAMMEIGFHRVAQRTVRADEFGLTCRRDFLPTNWTQFGCEDQENPVIGSRILFRSWMTERYFTFWKLNTDAMQTFLHIWGGTNQVPHIVVVQNHGLGGLWTQLDGRCLLYTLCSQLPPFLHVAVTNSRAWPNYEEISRTSGPYREGTRNLWRCVIPDRVNPESPRNGGYPQPNDDLDGPNWHERWLADWNTLRIPRGHGDPEPHADA